MTEILRIFVALFPVFIFLTVLIFLDSYKLVKLRDVIKIIAVGSVMALICSFVNSAIRSLFHLEWMDYSRSLAPVVEEIFKAAFLIYLIKKKRIGFMVDGAIYGFAIGAGFAFVENIYYLYSLQGANFFVWIVRGLGTAVMHGGTTAIFAIISKSLLDRTPHERWWKLMPGLGIAIIVHILFNQFFFGPVVTTLIFLTGLPFLMIVVFDKSEAGLQEWLEIGFDADAFLLEMINSGNITNTKLGRYLYSLKTHFPGEIVADMLCLLRIHLELSLRAKGILLLQESGLSVSNDPEIQEKFRELTYLEKQIGKTGKLAIMPFLHINSRDLWQLHTLKGKA